MLRQQDSNIPTFNIPTVGQDSNGTQGFKGGRMTDTKVEPKAVVKEHIPRQWGLHPDRVMEKLQNALIIVALTNGQEVIGQLVGYSEFQLTVRTTTGVCVISKGQVILLRPAPKAANDG
jgi:small nuclear ribonucleoprotein (snRNP)-like protein